MSLTTTRFDVVGGQLHRRHNELDPSRETLLFIHGLGESGLCFLEAFHQRQLRAFNIVVPDLLGFGESSEAADSDYSFLAQTTRILAVLDAIGVGRVNVIGHSMGGDIGTLFCQQRPDRAVSFVNVEGDLTPADLFISDQAVAAESEGRFVEWLREDFSLGKVLHWSMDWPSCVRYLASLSMCHDPAFLQSAREICALNQAALDRNAGAIGEAYRHLRVPRVYCWGSKSLSEESQEFLRDSGLANQPFSNSFHWVMLDQQELFYGFLAGFLVQHGSHA